MTDEILFKELPDPDSAHRFLDDLVSRHPSQAIKLRKNKALFSDIVTLASYSPLLAATILQHPEHIWWLNRKRRDSVVRNKEELLESLARFTLTNSQVNTHDLLSRFRRRELMRIFLRDIRRLVAIAEITEEISNLADSILEHALRVARQELDNRYGSPQETDEKGRQKPADFCIVSLGKLGSRELNYSSDIDLLFLYSDEGMTSGIGARGSVSNREYFTKLAETIVRIVGQQSGEGSAYRVDLRLRPHGRVGPLAMSVADTAKYYTSEAKAWERQVLIRSRSSSGAEALFRSFFQQVESTVFPIGESVEDALRNVRESKQKIDLEHINTRGIDVKLGTGGIREIEFIAQALQLAYGGSDQWLRSPHTLISLVRLADRKLISESEHTSLADAYNFLRQLEHILQMENGLQTHLIPSDEVKRTLVARKMRFKSLAEFDETVGEITAGVNAVFKRVFEDARAPTYTESAAATDSEITTVSHAADVAGDAAANEWSNLSSISVRLREMLAARPHLGKECSADDLNADYRVVLFAAIEGQTDFAHVLGALRNAWARLVFSIVAADLKNEISLKDSKTRQTELAEASIAAAVEVTARELQRRHGGKVLSLPLAVMGLGKIGGGGVDFDSDLDLVIVFDETREMGGANLADAMEYYSKAAEIFTNALSAITREGSLYRVDLRLRPFGRDGGSVISGSAFLDYVSNKAAIWELLAFVKLRAVGGEILFAEQIEELVRKAIHERARKISQSELAAETRRVRLSLEKEKTAVRHSRDIDIKFGPGGMLDIYFAIRFLQLRDGVPDEPGRRSTSETLDALLNAGSISRKDYDVFTLGYNFLSRLDHAIRLLVHRETRLSLANHSVLAAISSRMEFDDTDAFLSDLNMHRLAVRSAFDRVVI